MVSIAARPKACSLLAAGVDSLYWSSRPEPKAGLGDLLAHKAEAVAAGGPVRIEPHQGFALWVLPHGAFRFPVVVDCHEFRVHLGESRHLPAVWVQLRSSFIHEQGVEEALAATVMVAKGLLGVEVLPELHASRVDLYADFAGWCLTHADREGFVTHADLRSHFRAGTDEVETIQVGKSPLLVRLYRKDLEVRERGGHAPVFWSGWDGPVTRVEVQASSARLRDFGVGTVQEALASLGDVWRYATSEFVELRAASEEPREAWRLREEWVSVQRVGFERMAHSGVVPQAIMHGDRVRLLRSVFGYLTSLAAIDGEWQLAGLLRGLPGGLAEVARGRLFSDEVERKRSRLPRSVRLAPVGLASASAGPGKEAPWAPDPSQIDTRTDA